jgi:hypothetical protein
LKNELIEIDSVLVNSEILQVKFACDLSKCKGACCTLESEYGAPLREDEIAEMKKNLSAAMEYLPQEHVEEIKKKGFYESKEGELVTRSINNKACVLVFYEGDVAKCSLERAYFEGKSSFRKPVSCHLFPIRISDFGGDVLRYERFSECTPALTNGQKENKTIVESCKEALERKYSSEWYKMLVEASRK